jgi:hypothetical protein
MDCQAFYGENRDAFDSEPKWDQLWRRLADKCLCETWKRDSSRNPLTGEPVDRDYRTIAEWIETWCDELDSEMEGGGTVTLPGVALEKSDYDGKIRALAALGEDVLDIILGNKKGVSTDTRKEEAKKLEPILPREITSDTDRPKFRRAIIERALAWIREPTVTVAGVALKRSDYDEKIRALVALGGDVLSIIGGTKPGVTKDQRIEEAKKLDLILPRDITDDKGRAKFRRAMIDRAQLLVPVVEVDDAPLDCNY